MLPVEIEDIPILMQAIREKIAMNETFMAGVPTNRHDVLRQRREQNQVLLRVLLQSTKRICSLADRLQNDDEGKVSV